MSSNHDPSHFLVWEAIFYRQIKNCRYVFSPTKIFHLYCSMEYFSWSILIYWNTRKSFCFIWQSYPQHYFRPLVGRNCCLICPSYLCTLENFTEISPLSSFQYSRGSQVHSTCSLFGHFTWFLLRTYVCFKDFCKSPFSENNTFSQLCCALKYRIPGLIFDWLQIIALWLVSCFAELIWRVIWYR